MSYDDARRAKFNDLSSPAARAARALEIRKTAASKSRGIHSNGPYPSGNLAPDQPITQHKPLPVPGTEASLEETKPALDAGDDSSEDLEIHVDDYR